MQCQNGVKSFVEEYFHYSRIRRCLAVRDCVNQFFAMALFVLKHVIKRYKDPNLTHKQIEIKLFVQ